MKRESLIGKTYGKLQVFSLSTKKIGDPRIFWNCLCQCGNSKIVSGTDLRNSRVKSCGCLPLQTKEKHSSWQGCGEMSGSYWLQLKLSAAKRKFQLNIDKEYLWQLFLEQERKCALTGIDLKFDSTLRNRDGNASIDRKNPKLGYIKGNIQWVDKTVNRVKWTLSDKQFIEICQLVTQKALCDQKKSS